MHYQLSENLLPIAVGALNCNGSEERLTDCPMHNSLSFSYYCYHGNDASVVCQPLEGNLFVLMLIPWNDCITSRVD